MALAFQLLLPKFQQNLRSLAGLNFSSSDNVDDGHWLISGLISVVGGNHFDLGDFNTTVVNVLGVSGMGDVLLLLPAVVKDAAEKDLDGDSNDETIGSHDINQFS